MASNEDTLRIRVYKVWTVKKKKEKTGKEVPDVKVGPFASVGHAGSGMFTVNVTAMLQVSEPSSSWHTYFAVRILYNPSIITKYGLHVQFKFDKNQYMAWKESGFKDLTAEYEYVQRTGLRSAFSSQEIGGTLKSEDGKITVQGEKYHEKVPSEKWAGR
ncbi:hypothetical protein DdX_19425 [Ditylenchus destructor]|uniref:Uncharacterized protein n=1 Tax=Ditylenchus destructor TaxID=166010 RepID=A0AAD4MJF4_9BILA|nr:hypothetical protein DdX_19425 [Ditylenchus destructor]